MLTQTITVYGDDQQVVAEFTGSPTFVAYQLLDYICNNVSHTRMPEDAIPQQIIWIRPAKNV